MCPGDTARPAAMIFCDGEVMVSPKIGCHGQAEQRVNRGVGLAGHPPEGIVNNLVSSLLDGDVP